MTTGNVIGYRSTGAAIYLIQGGAEDDAPEQQVPADDAGSTWRAPSREEWETAQATTQRLQAILAEQNADPGGDGDTEEDASLPPQDRSKPPSWEDFDRIMSAQKRSARDTMRQRENARRQIEELTAANKAREADLQQQKAIAAAMQQGREEAVSQLRPATIRAAASPAMVKANARPDRINELLEFIQHDALTIDGNDVKGLDEQIDGLKTRFPEWFQPAEEKKPVPRMATGDRAPVENKPTRSADILAAQLGFGGAA